MSGYPIAWNDRWDSFDPSLAGSPYSTKEIEEYLVSCRAQFSPTEPKLAIRSIQLVATETCTTRRFWLFELVTDAPSDPWFAVVGSRMSPFFGGAGNVDRWLYAQTNDEGLSAAAFLDREIANHERGSA